MNIDLTPEYVVKVGHEVLVKRFRYINKSGWAVPSWTGAHRWRGFARVRVRQIFTVKGKPSYCGEAADDGLRLFLDRLADQRDRRVYFT